LPRHIGPKAQDLFGLKSRPTRLKPKHRNDPWQTELDGRLRTHAEASKQDKRTEVEETS